MRRPRYHFGTDPTYPLPGFTVLGPQSTVYRPEIVFDAHELLDGLEAIERRIKQMNDHLFEPAPIDIFQGVLEAHNATIIPIRPRSTT